MHSVRTIRFENLTALWYKALAATVNVYGLRLLFMHHKNIKMYTAVLHKASVIYHFCTPTCKEIKINNFITE